MIVAVYSVSGASVIVGVNVNVATVLAGSRATDPVALTQGVAQVSVKLAAPVIAAIGSLNVAATVVARDTPVAPAGGVTAVTIGASELEPVVKCHT